MFRSLNKSHQHAQQNVVLAKNRRVFCFAIKLLVGSTKNVTIGNLNLVQTILNTRYYKNTLFTHTHTHTDLFSTIMRYIIVSTPKDRPQSTAEGSQLLALLAAEDSSTEGVGLVRMCSMKVCPPSLFPR